MYPGLTGAAAALVLASTAAAQGAAYAQCGGQGFTGATTCVSGYTCVASSVYYSQCVPGTASGGSTTATTLATTTSPASTGSTTTAASGTRYLISFGDSYSQSGFDITSTKPSSSNPLGNPAFPGYTTANGNQRNWLDDLIAVYNSTLVLSYNLASGGATTDASLVAPYESTVLSLVDQVSLFSSSGLAAAPGWAPWTAADALFAVWIGVNDVGNAYGRSTWPTLEPQILDRYLAMLQSLHASGARRFLVLQVPPIYETPNFIAQGAAAQAACRAAAATYNADLAARVAAFAAANAGVTAWVVDPTAAFDAVIDDPAAYGAGDATCYSTTGTQCIWYNDYHPGQAIHDQVAKAVVAKMGAW